MLMAAVKGGLQGLKNKNEWEIIGSIKIIIAIIENMQGKIDHLLPKLVEAIKYLVQSTEKSNLLVALLIKFTSVLLWYNPGVALQALQQADCKSLLLSLILSDSKAVTSSSQDSHLLHLGLSSLLQVKKSEMPSDFDWSQYMQLLFTTTESESKKLKKSTDTEDTNDQDVMNEDDDEGDVDYEDDEDEDDSDWNEVEYLLIVRKLQWKTMKKFLTLILAL